MSKAKKEAAATTTETTETTATETEAPKAKKAKGAKKAAKKATAAKKQAAPKKAAKEKKAPAAKKAAKEKKVPAAKKAAKTKKPAVAPDREAPADAKKYAKDILDKGHGPCTAIRATTEKFKKLERADMLAIARDLEINPSTASIQFHQTRAGKVESGLKRA